ncbi:site-specific DNA-methyltransferase [Thermoanaerobacter brockii subsp. lactiethylicus]|uniref:Adenine specific DNA methylase Mod n=1 Tax=Thermoanaerobacter thermohydrosulfuricus WC1 TaxID=1198630 RepID=M8DQW7_THETY|nr:site-specific DNA-methyltransferase [Thermoanaerobacter thermohydrosulfuricus]EMT38901.1 Adenine specific DNA methylase Mod [Thermoanaerobacter thermohydrosulfuricus WC1]
MENKVSKEIFNPVQDNIKKLAELFPTAVKDGQVDFEALKQELGQVEEVGKEKYELTWPGKTLAKQLALTDVVGKTLKYVPEESKNPDTTENLYIEGDNLEVLKLLRNSYYGKIKMIYIDPPYNTGNDFIYKDDFKKLKEESDKEEGELDENGERLIKNQRSSARFHSNWLNMMYPRLKVAKDLLSDDGVIFISIDDNEVANLKKICDEIFGEENFRNYIIVRRYDKNINRQFIESGLPSLNVGVEYIVVYTKRNTTKLWPVFRPSTEERANFGYWKGFWNNADRPTMRYELLGVIPETGQWKWKKEIAYEAVKNYEEYINKFSHQMTLEEYWEMTGKVKKFIRRNIEGKGKNKGVEHWIPPVSGILRNSNWSDIFASKSLDFDIPFDNPKNYELLIELCKLAGVEDGDTILDFFSGSATTAHAVMQLNAEDGGKRKFIMVQLPEKVDEESEAYKAGFKTIADIGKERIRRAGEKIKEEFKDKEWIDDLDIGFKVFKVAETNIRWNDEVFDGEQITLSESALSVKDALDFNPGFTDIDVVYEIMLRHRDFPLTSKIEKLTNIGNRTYMFADSVVVCLEETITSDIVDKIASLEPKPIKIIFRDSAFDDDISLKLNILHRLDTQIKLFNQGKDQTYRVEFI